MKIIVTHSSPDLDAVSSVWVIKKFMPGWESAKVEFVPAGERFKNVVLAPNQRGPIENINNDEVIHVDTGLGPLDHHQTASDKVCAASLTLDFVKAEHLLRNQAISPEKLSALERLIKIIVDIDHFKEVFWENPVADYHDFSLIGILDGLKIEKPDHDEFYVDFMSRNLDALLHEFENKIWAEKEIGKGIKFKTRFGEGIGFETINDSVIKLAQKKGYVLVVRKDPRKGYVRIKARPRDESMVFEKPEDTKNVDIDLTLTYEKLSKVDPQATWFLHVGKKMLLNGSVKNPKMKATRLSLSDIIKVLETI
ncbi:MAG: hypothetical protein HYT08_04955 [Candidatus Levybacteria bacterium]|nr:hypothetical protein [Candidatus Levybacteria bacterium]